MGRRKPKTSGVRYDNETRKLARKLARRGKTVPEIARELAGPSQKTIRTWLTDKGIEPNPGRQRTYNRKKILQDLKRGMSRTKVCKKHGCSAKFVSELARGKIDP